IHNKDALVDGKEHDDDIQKSVSPDIHSSSSGAQTKKQEFEECTNNSSNRVNAVSSSVSTAGQSFINNTNNFSAAGPSNVAASPPAANSSDMPNLEDLTDSNDADAVGAEADINKLESIISVSLIPTTRIYKDHPTSQIIGDLPSTTQTKSMARAVRDQGGISQMFNEEFHTCMFACFLSQEEPKRVHQPLKDLSWIETMQEELLQNKKDKRGIFIRKKARIVAQGYTQKEGIDYEETRSMARAVRDQGFEDPENPNKVYKVVKALYGLHQAPRAWYEALATYLLENRFQRGTIDQTLFIKKQQNDILLMSSIGELTFLLGLQVKQKKDGIFISQDKYVAEILKKFELSKGKSASTPVDAEKPLLKDSDGEDINVHTYRLISWQCKKQTVVATSSTEAEYVAAASGCAQVLWIQNQLLDYG
nr:hypothetical protein [Tanacetum cinerariifolium]